MIESNLQCRTGQQNTFKMGPCNLKALPHNNHTTACSMQPGTLFPLSSTGGSTELLSPGSCQHWSPCSGSDRCCAARAEWLELQESSGSDCLGALKDKIDKNYAGWDGGGVGGWERLKGYSQLSKHLM